jgi:hypothetical protein
MDCRNPKNRATSSSSSSIPLSNSSTGVEDVVNNTQDKIVKEMLEGEKMQRYQPSSKENP